MKKATIILGLILISITGFSQVGKDSIEQTQMKVTSIELQEFAKINSDFLAKQTKNLIVWKEVSEQLGEILQQLDDVLQPTITINVPEKKTGMDGLYEYLESDSIARKYVNELFKAKFEK